MRTMCMCTGCFNLRWAAATVSGVAHDSFNGQPVAHFGRAIRLMDKEYRLTDDTATKVPRELADEFWSAQDRLDRILQDSGYMVAGKSKGDK